MNNKFSMIAGIAIFAVALGLSLQNAFDGYGVKSGSMHPEVLAQTNTGGTGTGSGSGSGGDTTSEDIGGGKKRYSYPTETTCEYKKTNDDTVYTGTWYGCKTGEHSCTNACVGEANF
jgi:hypothetical protein